MAVASRETFVDHFLRIVRYSGVSVVNVVLGQFVLVVCHSGFGWSGVASNLTAVTVGAGPAYLLSKRFVWASTARTTWRRHVVPFWAIAFVGLALSTFTVHLADQRWGTQLAVNGASIGAYGLLWIGKYLFLDRWMFADGGVL